MLNAISSLADRRPILFVLSILLSWMVLGTAIVFVAATLFQKPFTDLFIQLAGTVGATLIILLVASRLGWVKKIGITNFGTWSTWLLVVIIGCDLVYSGFYSFFGKITFDFATLFNTQEARAILLRQPIVGFVEETMFRGIVLYALTRVWGQTKRGLVAAVILQAALFGVFHSLQVLAGVPLETAVTNIFHTFVFSIWLGMLVINVGTLWPAIFLHALSNSFILIKGLNSQWVDPVSLGFIRATLCELPLILVGVFMLMKKPPASFVSAPNSAGQRSAP